MTLLIFEPTKTFPPRKGEVLFDRVPVKPGTNNFADEEWDSLSNHPDLQQYIEWGAIKVISSPAPEDKIPDAPVDIELSRLSADDAGEIIASTWDVTQLKQWLKLESRKGVVNQINRRVSELQRGEA